MLSNRLALTCLLALALVPAASAGEGLDLGLLDLLPEAPEVNAHAQSATDDAEEAYHNEVAPEIRAARGAAGGALAALQAEADRLALQAGLLLDTTLAEVNTIKETAQNAVPNIEEPAEEETEPAPDAPVAPSTTGYEIADYTEPLMLLGATAAAAGVLFWLAGSTGLAGAGQAAAGSSSDLRRLLPYASPMFTRFERDTVLGHPKREALYAQIMSKPGVTLQDLCEETGLSRTAVSHHLRLLEQQHLIVSKRMGRSRHFFENGGRYGRDQKDAYAVLHNDRSKEVHEFISKNPGAIQKDLCEAMDIQASVAHWHVKRLEEARLIEAVRQGRTVSYFPTQAAGYA